jgi:hypothetical protein
LWPDALPDGTDWKKGLSMVARSYEAGGMDGLRAMVRGMAAYQQRCEASGRSTI